MNTQRMKAFSTSHNDLSNAMMAYGEHQFAARGYAGKKLSEKPTYVMEEAINKEFVKTVVDANQGVWDSLKGYGSDDEIMRRFANQSAVKEFAGMIRGYMIDMIMPETLINGPLSYIADFKFAEAGDTLKFTIESNSLFAVTRAGHRKRSTNMQKSFNSTITLNPINHQITVGTNLYEIMTGKSFIAKDVVKAVRSIETEMLFQAWDAVITATDDVAFPSQLKSAAYSEEDLIHKCEIVTAYNQGKQAIIMGTPSALKKVLPSNANYRYLLDDDYVKMGALQTFNGYDVIPMAQKADPFNPVPYSLKFNDKALYIISPASDKLVKVGIAGGTMSHTDDAFENANLTQLTTLTKAWEAVVATNSLMAVIVLA